VSVVIEDRIIEPTFREDTNMVAATVIAGVDEPISGAGTPVIRRIPLRLLNVSLAEPGPGYQRTPNMSRVKKIARNWDWGPRENVFYCLEEVRHRESWEEALAQLALWCGYPTPLGTES